MTDQKPTPNGKDYWRGTVDTELASIKDEVKKTNENIENVMKKTNEKLDKIDGALRNGSDNKPGLIGQVREIANWKGKIEKISYAIIIFIILDMATRVLNSSTMEQLFHNVP